MNELELLPCPFCGSDYLQIWEADRQDEAKKGRDGRVQKYAHISHYVRCENCQTRAGTSWTAMDKLEQVTADIMSDSKYCAALLWNARQPIREDALKLANQLIASALSATKGDSAT